ncbi:hypothetical protein P691DRAFT_791786 [Macrolepiota fuliginosa MF-IS2]|uniref:Uncharacterized protein n=1 Tax=Macrolepiota fuliginosa MF-IS2 TaxID=1400762 RepID=A0A9P5XGA3_9AGAR|nr:hypothetical protein P691DRAFT_791786 [Macrolepiota fuliginosa MF-IS2]
MIAETGLFCLSITFTHSLAWFGSNGYTADTVAALNAPLAGITFNWFIIYVASNKGEAEKVSVSERISTLRFHEPYTGMGGTNHGMAVSAGAAFEILMFAFVFDRGAWRDWHSFVSSGAIKF